MPQPRTGCLTEGTLLSETYPCDRQGHVRFYLVWGKDCPRELMDLVELLGMYYSLQSNTEFWYHCRVAAFTQWTREKVSEFFHEKSKAFVSDKLIQRYWLRTLALIRQVTSDVLCINEPKKCWSSQIKQIQWGDTHFFLKSSSRLDSTKSN